MLVTSMEGTVLTISDTKACGVYDKTDLLFFILLPLVEHGPVVNVVAVPVSVPAEEVANARTLYNVLHDKLVSERVKASVPYSPDSEIESE